MHVYIQQPSHVKNLLRLFPPTTNGIASITSLSVLAFERYIIVSQPFQNRMVTRKGAVGLVIGIWIYSFGLTVPPLVGWGQYVNEAANISCSVNWESQSYNAMTYICYLFIFGLVIPLILIVISYINIVIQIKQNSFRVGQVKKAERRIAYMVLLMIVAFLLAWTPYAVLALLIQFGDASFISPGLRVIPSLLAKSSICYNPIIYVGLNAQFRQSWRQSNFVSSNASETYAVCVSKYLTQNVDGPIRNPHGINLHLKECAKERKKKMVVQIATNYSLDDYNGSMNAATEL
ncbi:hypothetical protein HHI36_009472 [Cryptolaemus montrouzieri]|uniref:G-protein coupled receptors family 1 profile domain-containing protein n=1 Tax=Cryptolaemus montrouzieri TaxID=559131 RepID=A0ABD2MFS4_9CUCU